MIDFRRVVVMPLYWLLLCQVTPIVVFLVATFALAADNTTAFSIDLTAVLISFVATLPATVAAILAYMSSRRNEAKTAVVESKVSKQGDDMLKLEVNTNSIKDALVKATRATALLEGHATGVVDGKARATADGIATLLQANISAGPQGNLQHAPVVAAPGAPVPVEIVGGKVDIIAEDAIITPSNKK